nr:NYN domain-containing protein [uncultured Deefgea sp.]
MNHKFAVFIDGDNISPKLLTSVLNEINKHGDIVLKRVYGDWTAQNMGGWKELLREVPIRTFQQFRHGEQATDGSMIMDAIEISTAQNRNFNAFAIVSSDSDFYSLALRLREHELFVLGVGRRTNTKQLFINSCNQFLFTDNITPVNLNNLNNDHLAKNVILNAYNNSTPNDEGWIQLGVLGIQIRKSNPAFSLNDYNCSTLLAFVKTCESELEIKTDNKQPTNYFIRPKVSKSATKTNRKKGFIKNYFGGYGFISSGENDYFFLRTNINEKNQDRTPKAKDAVFFESILEPNKSSNDPLEKNGKAINIEFA